MFMQIAIGAIGIGIVLMVGYLIVAQVRAALPTTTSNIQIANECFGRVGLASSATCINTTGSYAAPATCGATNLTSSNTSSLISCPNVGYSTGTTSVQATVFAGFGLIAVGIIVLAAFGLINIFK